MIGSFIETLRVEGVFSQKEVAIELGVFRPSVIYLDDLTVFLGGQVGCY